MKICHIAVNTQNLEGLKTFYITYFSGTANALYENKAKGFRSYFIRFASGPTLELMTTQSPIGGENPREVPPENAAYGYAHMAFSVGDRQAVDELTLRLIKDGYPVVSGPRITGDGYYESCVLDPDGNRVEITCD